MVFIDIIIYTSKENVNILVVAWGNGSTFPLYNNASSNIRLVGKQTGLVFFKIKLLFFNLCIK